MSMVPNLLAQAIRNRLRQQYGVVPPNPADPYAAIKLGAAQAFAPRTATPALPNTPAPKASDLQTLPQISAQSLQTDSSQEQPTDALAQLMQFEQSSPQPSYQAPKRENENPWTALATGLAALFSPQLAPGIGIGMQQRQQQFDTNYARQTQEAQNQYQAQVDARNSQESALEKAASVEVQQQNDAEKNAIAQQRADAYAQNVLSNWNYHQGVLGHYATQDSQRASYELARIGLDNNKLAFQYWNGRRQYAQALATAGMRSDTALQVADQNARVRLATTWVSQQMQNSRADERNRLGMYLGRLRSLTTSYDSLLSAASKPGAPAALRLKLQQMLAPNSDVNKTLADVQKNLGLDLPQFPEEQGLQAAMTDGMDQANEIFPSQPQSPTVNYYIQGGTPPQYSQPPAPYGGAMPFTPPSNLVSAFGSYVNEASQDTKVPQGWIYALMSQEDPSGNPRAQSPAGALGPMQLMPSTAQGLGVNPLDPRANIVGGSRYFAQLLDQFNGNPLAAAAAYNAGPASGQAQLVLEGKAPTIPETLDYVQKFATRIGMPLPWTGTPQYNATAVSAPPQQNTADRVPAKPVESPNTHKRPPQGHGAALNAQDIDVAKKLYQQYGGGEAAWNRVVTLIRQYEPGMTPQEIGHYRAQITGVADMGWGTL